jgi:hypothetical protein
MAVEQGSYLPPRPSIAAVGGTAGALPLPAGSPFGRSHMTQVNGPSRSPRDARPTRVTGETKRPINRTGLSRADSGRAGAGQPGSVAQRGPYSSPWQDKAVDATG